MTATSTAAGSVAWLDALRRRCGTDVHAFVTERVREHFTGRAADTPAVGALPEFVTGGKFLRPMFAYTGWRCGGPETAAALRAAASLELLHCFALVQDDVMDGSARRRGRPSMHVRFARWHEEQGLSGSAARFGESAAVLMGDLFLVWSEQLLHESGLDAQALARGRPGYDRLRSELAVGQLGDLVNDARTLPSWADVLDVIRRKSGNYTVRRPLEFGAALAGCPEDVVAALGTYGGLLGEAFQFRDDLLGVFGDPAVTGKPAGDDLRERKASSVVVLARDLADRGQRADLTGLLALDEVDDEAVARWRELITATGARDQLEKLVDERVRRALEAIDLVSLPRQAADALTVLATRCTERVR
ncbi:geranylgeranyl diphosphate synthase, type I [Amycolatopsis pretoriensis]|uniref:Geranylgeranyl diphosphate synthase, type I n=1 Tax=Amycolatopsis pretoriensis TaxID=218821 RepID=A0A1H5RGG9_9PSEU|nr:polyprenyl synthetase family protein [Amycolatopsis pretoriensis]SEF37462.1 geranylgeranyl diphosphate synthase, type I [Amycolatopsis pretoriensis]